MVHVSVLFSTDFTLYNACLELFPLRFVECSGLEIHNILPQGVNFKLILSIYDIVVQGDNSIDIQLAKARTLTMCSHMLR